MSRQRTAIPHAVCSYFLAKEGKHMFGNFENRLSFADVCNRKFGREVIYTNAKKVDTKNVVNELNKAKAIHMGNAREIDYLDRYVRGDQPILYRNKKVRPEINNRVVENHAYEIVQFKTAQKFGEPVQYVRRGTDEDAEKSKAIVVLNDYMISESKAACDIEIGEWQSICGTSYRFMYMDLKNNQYDEAPFGLECLDPRYAGVVYGTGDGKKPVFGYLLDRRDEKDESYDVVYTSKARFEIKNGKVVNVQTNGIGYIPIIEYPNNTKRLSDIELITSMLDALNTMQSDRVNGIEQFVQAFILFRNCEIDEEGFKAILDSGGIAVKDTVDGKPADVKMLVAELSQDGTQVAKDDLYENILLTVGMPSREQNTGGDTGQAVYLRNGWDFAEQRAELWEAVFEKAEYQFLKMILSVLRTKNRLDLKLSDIEVKVTRSKMDNMSIKVNALNLLLNMGIDPQTAIKTVGLWSDPEEVYLKSKDVIQSLIDKQKSVGGAPIPDPNKNPNE